MPTRPLAGGRCPRSRIRSGRPGSDGYRAYPSVMGLYDDVYAAFEEADVRYVVVGGMAVVMSGHVRATVDLMSSSTSTPRRRPEPCRLS